MTEEKERLKLSKLSYFLYYIVLFFAYWFGSHRFDFDGDGDFDPEDVQAYLQDKGFLSRNFKKAVKKKPLDKSSDEPPPDSIGSPSLIPTPSGMHPKSKRVQKHRHPLDTDKTASADFQDFLGAEGGDHSLEVSALEKIIDKQIPPVFILTECVVVLLFWFIFMFVEAGKNSDTSPLQVKAGLDSISSGSFDLRWSNSDCDDFRPQIWRWWTYQFTHIGAMHVLMNIFLCLMMGIPLEGIHGWPRMALMFNVGVIGGALLYYVNDAHKSVVGCSGGCYALIGIHLADLIMNWQQKKFRLPTLLLIVILAAVDILSYMASLSDENASQSAHVGGAISGLIIGVLVCRNLKKKKWEYVVMGVMATLGVILVVFCLIWCYSADAGPINIWEAASGTSGHCWTRQIYFREVNENEW
eukprot:CAMPEP_0206448050 /NCGR_PEP_ID=MMETSP0324_2-20121206/17202_1 /ASSEMBLY_ACC=CAM_ASM_000836 /TAXON_ID=2866 /ORGANISM="Crypthecodinium cohnii, Strain Seligo" /LENGTH=411 /DNA_ID=CAMNT_0053917041 /DNA_START=177 /DNA_END=1409 /DNA_ORIENTATION=+